MTRRFRGKVKFWDGDMIRLGEEEFNRLSKHCAIGGLPGFRFWWLKRLMFHVKQWWKKL